MKPRSHPLATAAPLNEQLKAKGRNRRSALLSLAQASIGPTSRRNDLLPGLSIAFIPIDQLRSAKRKLRKLDPAHVREVASAISNLGFRDPLLIGKDNDVIDG